MSHCHTLTLQQAVSVGLVLRLPVSRRTLTVPLAPFGRAAPFRGATLTRSVFEGDALLKVYEMPLRTP